MSVAYVHPLTITILSIWAVGRASAAIAGEIDRGTMELLLAQPIRRSHVVVAHWIVDLVTIPILCASMLGGTYVGTWLMDLQSHKDPLLRVDPMRFPPCLVMVAGLVLAVSGYTLMLSAAGRSRGRVLGLAIVVTLLPVPVQCRRSTVARPGVDSALHHFLSLSTAADDPEGRLERTARRLAARRRLAGCRDRRLSAGWLWDLLQSRDLPPAPVVMLRVQVKGVGIEPTFSSFRRWRITAILPFDGVDRRGVEPRLPGCKPGVVPSWTSSPSITRNSKYESRNPKQNSKRQEENAHGPTQSMGL